VSEPLPDRIPPVWIFGLTALPSGVFNVLIAFAMPFLLRKSGFVVEQIANVSALVSSSMIYYFFWSPIIDIGLRRRTWLVLVSVLSGILGGAALLLPLPNALPLFTILMLLATAVNCSSTSANGGLMSALLPESFRGRAGGWYQTGNLGGSALGGGLILLLGQKYSVGAAAAGLIAVTILPALAAFFLDEPPPAASRLKDTFRPLFRDLWTVLRSRSGIMTLLFFAAPLNSGAAMNLFSAIATDYHAPAQIVTWITGFAGGLVMALGSLAGGFLGDRINRRHLYIGLGFAASLCCLLMLLAPLTPAVYITGSTVYLILVGVCYAAFTGLALDVVNNAPAGGSTQFSVFSAAGNIPIVYMTWFDGKGYGLYGPRGLLAFDGLGNAVGAVLLILLLTFMFQRKTGSKPAIAI